MKVTSAVSALIALLPALSSAVPLSKRDTEAFTLLAIRSGNQNVHLRQISANANQFWIDRPTTTFCPLEASACPAGTETVLLSELGGNRASTSHLVPGEQSVYIAGPDAPTPGALQFNSAHASPPTGSIVDGFLTTESNFEFPSGGFYACPAMGAYYITTNGNDSPFCIGIAIHRIPYDGPQPAAWQYV